VRLSVDPRERPDARDRIRELSTGIARYVQAGMPLDELEDFIMAAEAYVMDGRRPPDPKIAGLLEEKNGN